MTLFQQKRWIFFSVFLFTIIQFFWVLSEYTTIESGKVFFWTIAYILPISVLVSFTFNKPLTNMLFYAYPKKHVRVIKTVGFSHIKNRILTGILSSFILCFLSYDSIIQTNDWLGKTEYHTFNTEIISVSKRKHGRRGPAYVSYDVEVMYNGSPITISTRDKYYVGETFNKTLNIGGFWGIIFEE